MDKMQTIDRAGPAERIHPFDKKFFLRLTVLALFALALVILSQFYFSDYTKTVLIRAFMFSLAALSVGVLWGYTGILSFSQSTFFGIGTYSAALVFLHFGLSTGTFIAAILIALVVAGVIAAVTGWFAFWYRATPFYVAVVTLVLAIVAMQLIYSGGDFTGSSSGLVGFDVPSLSVSGWFVVTGIMTVLITSAAAVFVHSDYGLLLTAIRDNEERCRYLGINTTRTKIVLFVVMAGIAAIAGLVYACVTVLAAPEQVGFVFGTQLVIDTALGGRASVLGAVLGTTLLEWISSYLNGILPFLWQLIIGAVFVVVIVALPEGFLPPVIRFVSRHLLGRIKVLHIGEKSIDIRPLESPTHGAKTAGEQGRLALSIQGLTKRYGHLSVLKGLDLDVKGGEIVGVVGPNGAGKTTLMGCISDGLERTAGDISINAVRLTRQTPTGVVGLGLARSFQKTSVYENLTVGECLLLSLQKKHRLSMVRTQNVIYLPEAAWQVARDTALLKEANEVVRNLSHGMKRALELTMALCLEPSVLLLDEPTAGLTKVDRELIGAILMDLSQKEDLTIVLIEHDFDFVKHVCSRLVVLHQGTLIMDGTVDEVVHSPVVLDIYSGNEP